MPGRLNPGGGADRTRTGGLVIPNHVRFPLRYCSVNPRIPPGRPRLSGVPFSKERISLRFTESWRSGKAHAPSQAPHLALPLGRDHAPGGRVNRES